MSEQKPVIAIIGGTGALGTGLARRWLQAGYKVIIGSRTAEKAATAVDDLRDILQQRGVSSPSVEAMDNSEAASKGEVVVLTVPFSHHSSTLEPLKHSLQGKILVDVTVPLVPPKVAHVQLPEQGSAGQIAQTLLGDEVHVVSAFQNVPAIHLQEGDDLDCDALVCGNSKEARAKVIELANAVGMRGLHAGPINNAAAVEAMTSVLIFINKQYKSHAGVRVTGVEA
ncbi:NADPH-dependent F420 reductase [Microbulbifer agarilyticus]|uniref:NADPH-dependent F420 reductase n=1 Tax=Microbulbifer agarilyticus TaxID=260552 RepID=UPI001C97FC42|nr:NADPH-dependent F420 reductase [Microbulbifer agarilyticus]MBY6211177.1 NADPH-dependent F420 reductase [Microbulbifer agarilyticus]